MKSTQIDTGQDDIDRRIDRVIRKFLPQKNLGEIYKALRKGLIRIDGSKISQNYRIRPGDTIEFRGAMAYETENMNHRNSAGTSTPSGSTVSTTSASTVSGANESTESENRLSVPALWENEDLIIINKPKGRLIHGENGLDREIQDFYYHRSSQSLSFKPGPLHRLDRNTSGIITFSKSLKGARSFTKAMESGRLSKVYLALLEGILEKEIFCALPLSRDNGVTKVDMTKGVEAKTLFRPLVTERGMTLAEVRLFTGRTHQIRAHAAAIDHPLLGDGKYDAPSFAGGYRLHAHTLTDTGETPLFPSQTAPLPGDFLPRGITLPNENI